MAQRSFKHAGKPKTRPRTQTNVKLPNTKTPRRKTEPVPPKSKTQSARIPVSPKKKTQPARPRTQNNIKLPTGKTSRPKTQPVQRGKSKTKAIGKKTERDLRRMAPAKAPMNERKKLMLIFGGSFLGLLLIISIIMGVTVSRKPKSVGPRAATPRTEYRRSGRRRGYVHFEPEEAKPLPELGGLTMKEYMEKHGLDKNEMLQERQKRRKEFNKKRIAENAGKNR